MTTSTGTSSSTKPDPVPELRSLEPIRVVPGGRLWILGSDFPLPVGSAEDVINDAASRARFRLALAAADRAFFVETGDDDLSRMTSVWDLEGAEPVTGLSAA